MHESSLNSPPFPGICRLFTGISEYFGSKVAQFLGVIILNSNVEFLNNSNVYLFLKVILDSEISCTEISSLKLIQPMHLCSWPNSLWFWMIKTFFHWKKCIKLFLFLSTDIYDPSEAVVSWWKDPTLQNWPLRGEESLFLNCRLQTFFFRRLDYFLYYIKECLLKIWFGMIVAISVSSTHFCTISVSWNHFCGLNLFPSFAIISSFFFFFLSGYKLCWPIYTKIWI